MTDKTKAQLLHIIHTQGNINSLRRSNFSFRQIAEMIESAIHEGLLQSEEDRITLSSVGESFLLDKRSLLKVTDKKKWIEPHFKSKINPIDKNDVFLPAQNELSFLK